MACEAVAGGFDWDCEVEVLVRGVRRRSAKVEVDARSAQQRPGDADIFRELAADVANALRAGEEERVVLKQAFVLADALIDHVDRLPARIGPAGRDVVAR